MALDKLVDSSQLESDLTTVANAIRAKTGGSSQLAFPSGFASAIAGISTGLELGSVSYTQRNTSAAGFIDNVDYSSDTNFANSSIYTYAHGTSGKDKPTGAQITIPESGTLTLIDGKRSMTIAVSAGTVNVYNITPGTKGVYIVRNSSGNIIAAGTLSPSDTGLRMIYLTECSNVRDLGGWTCDGGYIKYGKIFRGSRLFYINHTPNDYDVAVLHDLLGIQHELELRYLSQVPRNYSQIGKDVGWTQIDGIWYGDVTGAKAENAKQMLELVFDCVANNIPLYFHCAGGADRTGALAMLIEAIMGVSQSDIDKDYELTCFFSGIDSNTGNEDSARRRNEDDWKNIMNALSSYPGNTISAKVIAFAITLGIPVSKINAFRASMSTGTPSTITNPYGTVTVTKSQLTHIEIDNDATTTEMYQPYTATLTAQSGYSLSGASVTITMGGVDITSTAYSNGVINIPKVTGAVVISATAASMYTNQITQATAEIGGSALYNGTGYKQDYRWNSSNTEDNGSITGVQNKFAVGYIELKPNDVVHFYGDILKGTSGGLVMHVQSASDSRLVRATLANWADYTNRSDIMAYMTNIDYDTSTNTLRSFKWTGGTNAVKGYMHISCVGTFTEGVTVVTINEEM